MVWKTIKGYEGYYEVSDTGRVRSLTRVIPNVSETSDIFYRTLHGREMKLTYDPINGYYVVNLRKNCTSNVRQVHRIVAETFLENPDNLPTVNHIDGNKLNNDLSNLEWASYSWNNLHALQHGLRRPRGVTICQYTSDGELVGQFRSVCEASRATGIGRANISHCVNRRTLSAGGYVWRKLSESATTIPQGSTPENELPVEAQRPSEVTEDIVYSASNSGQK